LHQGLALEVAAPPLGIALAHDEPGAFEHVDVARHRGQREIEGRGQLADGRVTLGEPREDGAARGVGEGREHGIERFLGHRILYLAKYAIAMFAK
jgi:hypothetical protein